MTDTLTIPASILINGLWQAANWSAELLDDDTGEILLTAVAGETELAIRLTMDDVALLRQTLPAFAQANARRDATTNPSNPSNPSDATCYDCSTNQTRLDTLDAEYVTLCQHLDRLKRRIKRIEHDNTLSLRIEALAHEAAQMFSAIERRLDALEQLQKRYDRLMDSAASAHSLVMLSDRVAAIESILSFRGQFDRLPQIEDRLAALESEPAQDETLLTVDIMAAYDLIARRERAAGGA